MDSDLQEILVELRSTDWEQKLRDCKTRKIRDQVAEASEKDSKFDSFEQLPDQIKHTVHKRVGWTSLGFLLFFIAVVMGIGVQGFTYTEFAGIFIMYFIFISWFTGKVTRMTLEKTNKRRLEEAMEELALNPGGVFGPKDLLQFWKDEVQANLNNLSSKVEGRLTEVTSTMTECEAIQTDLKNFEEVHTPEATLAQLQEKVSQLKIIKDEAKKVSQIILTVRNGFAEKIAQLEKLIGLQEQKEKEALEKKRKLEDTQERIQELNLKISKVLGDSNLQLDSWEEDKDQVRVELQALMISFENQLLEAKSYVQAQLELGI
jgi:DNA repair exonuclease SbcCD ATPase subunit